MDLHVTMIFTHICRSAHVYIHRHMCRYYIDILTRLSILIQQACPHSYSCVCASAYMPMRNLHTLKRMCSRVLQARYVVVVCWLLNVPATCECISGTDLLRQVYVLPHSEAADPTFYFTQSQYTDTGPTSPSANPIMPGAW